MFGSQEGSSDSGAHKKRGKWLLIIGGIGVSLAVILVIVFGMGDGNQSGLEDKDAISNKSSSVDESEPRKAMIPPAVDAYQTISDYLVDSEYFFTITDDAVDYINSHPDFFPGNEFNLDAMMDEVDRGVDFMQIVERPHEYSDRLIIAYGDVNFCGQIEIEDGVIITMIEFLDPDTNYNYLVYYLGIPDEPNEGYRVEAGNPIACLALPFGAITLENPFVGSAEVVIGAACYLE